MNQQLPKGWAWSTIGDVTEVNPRVNKKDIPDDLTISFLPMTAVAEVSGELDLSDRRPAADLKRKSYRGFREGDLLVAKITPSMENGKAAIARGLANEMGFGSTEFHVLRPNEAVDERFLFHFVVQDSFRADAASSMTGTAGQLRVPADYLRRAAMPLPSRSEQERIVTAIEEHLSRLDAAQASLRTAARKAILLERAILQRADDPMWPAIELGEVLVDIEAGKSFKTPGRPAAMDEWA